VSARRRHEVVVAGPSSPSTVPGLIVTEIVDALAESRPVTRVEVDSAVNFESELYRAPSLAAAHRRSRITGVESVEVPPHSRSLAKIFRQIVTPQVDVAVAFAWPGLEVGWIRALTGAADLAGARSIVACVSLPRTSPGRIESLLDHVGHADVVIVGSPIDARAVQDHVGPDGPRVEYHPALGLRGRDDRGHHHEVTAFLPRDDVHTLSTLLAAFDAIPEAWVHRYRLNVVMRYSGSDVPDLVNSAYHAANVALIDGDLTDPQIDELGVESSAVIVANPAPDSRAFASAIEQGVATVVLAHHRMPRAGERYVGALLADASRPVSIHVALTHALRLAELKFPSPQSWEDLARRIVDGSRPRVRQATMEVVPPAP
jgi:hypothetical protein